MAKSGNLLIPTRGDLAKKMGRRNKKRGLVCSNKIYTVCELHFQPYDIERVTTCTVESTGKVLTAKLKTHLIKGYLKDECRNAYKVFLKSKFANKGKHIATRIAGQSLADILKVHAEVYEIVQSRLEESNYYKEKSRDHTSPFYLSEQLLYLLDNNVQCTPVSTPCPRSPSDSVAPSVTVEGNRYSNQPPSSSELETTPEDALPGNVQWQCNSENSYFYKTPKRRPSSPKLTTKSATKLPMPQTEVNEVMSEVTHTLLKNKELHETLANNINYVLNSSDVNEEQLRDLATAELDAKIQNVMKKTQEDPFFDAVVETLLVNTPIAESISKRIEEEGTGTPTTSNPHQHAYKTTTPATDYYQSNNVQMDSRSSSVTSNSVIPDTSNTNNVILFNGSLEHYVKTSHYENVNNQLSAPFIQTVQNPLCVNTAGNLVVLPQGFSSTNSYQYSDANGKQYYLVNQPVNQPVVMQPVNRQLTEEEILAMPTVILNDTKNQSTKKGAKKKAKTILPKAKIEIATNLQEYISLFDANKESPNVKLDFQKDNPPNASTSQTCSENLTAQPLPNQNDTLTTISEENENPIQTSSSTVKSKNSDTEQTVPARVNENNKERDLVEVQKGNKKSSQRSIRSISSIRTPSPRCSSARRPTPRSSGSHVRTLRFATPPKLGSSSKKKLECQGRSPDFVHKKQAAKTLFKSKTDDVEHEEKENGKSDEKPKIKKPWDSNIREQLRPNKSESPEKRKVSPIKKKRRERKIVKRQLNTTDQDGVTIENAPKTPEHPESPKNTNDKVTESTTISQDQEVNKSGSETSEICLKTILSPSKVNVNKKILKTEANVISQNDVTPDPEKQNVQYPVTAKRNISFLPETTPSKEDFDFKTDLTTGFSTMTPMTQLLKANGINDSLAIDTPNFPLTPGTFLTTQEPSPYYEPDEQVPVKLEEDDGKNEKPTSLIRILSDVTIQTSVTETTKEKSGIALSDHLRKFNHNIIGKKNLNLMSRESNTSDDESTSSSSSSSSSDSDSDEKTNETVICGSKERREENEEPVIDPEEKPKVVESDAEPEHAEPDVESNTRGGYALRTRKKNVSCSEIGREKHEDIGPRRQGKGIREESEEWYESSVSHNSSDSEDSEEQREVVKKQPAQNKVDEQIKTTGDYIKHVISTVNLKDIAPINSKLKLSTPKKAVLSDLEAKRLRTLNILKQPKVRKRKNDEATTKKTVLKPKPTSLQTRRRSRKSDSPKKIVANNKSEQVLKNNNTVDADKDDLRQSRRYSTLSVTKEPETQDVSNKEASIKSESKTSLQPDQKKAKGNERSKDSSGEFFPELSSEEEDQEEKEQLVAGLRERGILLVPNKSPKKKVSKQEVDENVQPLASIKNCESQKIPSPCSPSYESAKNDFDVFSTQDKDCIKLVFDEAKKTTKKFEDYNVAGLAKAQIITIEANVGDVDIRLSCLPFQCLLDIESTLVNVLIPKRTRSKPIDNVDTVHKVFSESGSTILDDEASPSHSKTTVVIEENVSKSTVLENVNIVDKSANPVSELREIVVKATPSPSGRCSERSEGYDELMNFAVVGSGPEESGEDTVKSGKKRKHRTDSTSSTSTHIEKKSKSSVDPKLIKGLDITSFLNKIHT